MIKKFLQSLRQSSKKIESTLVDETNKVRDDNFEQSPLRFEYEVLMEEYRAVRQEIMTRVQIQQQIINYSLTLAAGVVALMQILPGDDKLVLLRPFLPFLSLLFSAFTLAYLEQDVMIAHLGRYTDRHLRAKMEKIVAIPLKKQVSIWEWDKIRADSQFYDPFARYISFFLAISRYGVTFLPALGTIILYWSMSSEQTVYPVYETFAFVISVTFLLVIIISGVYSVVSYLGLPISEMPQKTINIEMLKNPLVVVIVVTHVLFAVLLSDDKNGLFRDENVDFNIYHAASLLLAKNENIYDGHLTASVIASMNREYILGSDYIYPPFLALVILPFLFIPVNILCFIWYILNLISIIASVHFAFRFFTPGNVANQQLYNASTLSLLFAPTLYSLYVGQVNGILLFMLVLLLYYSTKKNNIVSGALLGLCILIKLTPLLMLLFFIVRRKFFIVFWSLTTIFLFVLLTYPALGGYWWIYARKIRDMSSIITNPINQSIFAFFGRILTPSVYTNSIFDMSWLAQTLAITFSFALIIAAAVAGYGNKSSEPHTNALYFSLLMVVLTIVSPISWENFYVILVFPISVLLLYWQDIKIKYRRSFIIGILLIFLQRMWDPFVNSPNNYELIKNMPLALSLGLYGAIILAVTIYAVLRSKTS